MQTTKQKFFNQIQMLTVVNLRTLRTDMLALLAQCIGTKPCTPATLATEWMVEREEAVSSLVCGQRSHQSAT